MNANKKKVLKTKVCAKCKKRKLLNKFHKAGSHLTSRCGICENERSRQYENSLNKKQRQEKRRKNRLYARERYKENPEKCREETRKSYKKNKEKVCAKQRGYYRKNKEKCSKACQRYFKKNEKKVRKMWEDYREQNAEEIKKRRIKWDKEHKEEIKKYGVAYRTNNRDEINRRRRLQYEENRGEILAGLAIYRERNRDKLLNHGREYRKQNKDKINKRCNSRMKTDINYRMSVLLRHRVRSALKEHKKSISTERLIGCNLGYFKKYFKAKFTKDMTWEKFLNGKVVIDHIHAIYHFDLRKESDLKTCFHYTNMQPLWKRANLLKGTKPMLGNYKENKWILD